MPNTQKSYARYTIRKNPDTASYESATEAVHANNGYCPCELTESQDTLCPCKAFRTSQEDGECHCGRFVKVLEQANSDSYTGSLSYVSLEFESGCELDVELGYQCGRASSECVDDTLYVMNVTDK